MLATCAAGVALPTWLGRVLDPATALAAQAPLPAEYFAASFGLDDTALRRLLAAALGGGGDYADLYLQHTVGSWLVMEDGQVNRAYTAVGLGLGVRVLQGEQTGYAFSQILEMPELLATARAAAALARAGKQAPGARGIEVVGPSFAASPDFYPMQKPWPQAGAQARMDLLARVETRLRKADPAISKTLLQLSDSVSRVLVLTSEGVKRADLRPRSGLYASAVAERNGRTESGQQDLSARAGLEMYSPDALDQLADVAAENTMLQFEARPLPAGEMPVILAAGSAGILLHEAIGHGLEADFNRRGISTYAERLGQKVAGPLVTVVDDGTIPGSHGAINFDDEGADSRRTVLVDKGKLVSFLHDRLSARWYKTASTGSGRRQSYQHAPMPRMRATFMEPGPHDPAEILAAVKKGLYARQFTNGQVNIGAGDFSFFVKTGWAVENGRKTHPVKDLNVVGNGPQALARITMVGHDLALATGGYMCGKLGQSVPVSQGLPTTLVSALTVGGACDA
ncbi:MAG: TldD/PmbA family protein [Deltaproteobacteria bacterium]|nr:TldD/PmbA family protein [Deltaproteobacteria bacterium]